MKLEFSGVVEKVGGFGGGGIRGGGLIPSAAPGLRDGHDRACPIRAHVSDDIYFITSSLLRSK
jgi:hypothetical protein